ncbi:MAG: signal peptidase I [Carnobacterium sp.]|uniref:Signal peptidase I n=1 Tax=Carnobacterium antarcticum TaxID=2126436 RepID=A0ABW4NU32_9LACT|nr:MULTISPECIES: signal peptidase I [unclassified Carnobacterium]ALV21269.1 Signal peptidase I [Carnobacterium sp. CP1]QQP69293.1 signal peptidase I [Carnobacterium sp. CS13]
MEKKTWRNQVWDWVKPFLLALVLTAFFRNFIFLPMTIEGSSMIPTFQQSDQIIVETIYHINRFDLIVFKDASNRTLVKRVIGLPNETLRYEDDQLYIDDRPIEEPFLENDFVNHAGGTWTSDFTLEELTGQKTVPEDEYFVLGDNRRSSNDSRYFGSIPSSAIIGETTMIYFPFQRLSIVQ